ncbi:hypothetical protein J4453_03715 [Candidatus Woesearchaeota archaeon]|nr:hypothetical protein [Candidatus Woesearchaeota archaeon]
MNAPNGQGNNIWDSATYAGRGVPVTYNGQPAIAVESKNGYAVLFQNGSGDVEIRDYRRGDAVIAGGNMAVNEGKKHVSHLTIGSGQEHDAFLTVLNGQREKTASLAPPR